MIGIISDDFELLLKKNNYLLNELNNDMNSLKKSCPNLISNLNNGDLKFLINKFNLELIQMDNILKKTVSYQNLFKSIYISYNEQVIKIVRDIETFKP